MIVGSPDAFPPPPLDQDLFLWEVLEGARQGAGKILSQNLKESLYDNTDPDMVQKLGKRRFTFSEASEILANNDDQQIQALVTSDLPPTAVRLSEVLASDLSTDIRHAIGAVFVYRQAQAADSNDPTVLIALAQDIQMGGLESVRLSERLARNPYTPPEVLGALMETADAPIIELIVQHPQAPSALLVDKAKDADIRTARLIFESSQASSEVLESLAHNQDPRVREWIASDGKTPPEILAYLAEDDDVGVLQSLGKNPHTPSDILESLARDPRPSVVDLIQVHPNTPPAMVKTLRKERDRRQIAESVDTPVETLVELASDPTASVRAAAASNQNLPVPYCEALILDHNSSVGLAALRNPGARRFILTNASDPRFKALVERLGFLNPPVVPQGQPIARSSACLSDQDNNTTQLCGQIWGTRCAVPVMSPDWSHGAHPIQSDMTDLAIDPTTTPQALAALAQQQDLAVRSGLLHNPNTPGEVLEALIQDEDLMGDLGWRLTLARHPNLTIPMLADLATDRCLNVRQAILTNQRIPEHIRAILTLAY